MGKRSAWNAGDTGNMNLTPWSGRSPGGGHGIPLQYSCLENPMDRGAWWVQSIGSQRVRHNWNDLACMQAVRALEKQLNWELVLNIQGEKYSLISRYFFPILAKDRVLAKRQRVKFWIILTTFPANIPRRLHFSILYFVTRNQVLSTTLYIL